MALDHRATGAEPRRLEAIGRNLDRLPKVRGMPVTTVEVPDVRAIRKKLHMSQHFFAASYRIPLATMKNWEQMRRAPDAPAAAYLLAIRRRPKEVMEAVAC